MLLERSEQQRAGGRTAVADGTATEYAHVPAGGQPVQRAGIQPAPRLVAQPEALPPAQQRLEQPHPQARDVGPQLGQLGAVVVVRVDLRHLHHVQLRAPDRVGVRALPVVRRIRADQLPQHVHGGSRRLPPSCCLLARRAEPAAGVPFGGRGGRSSTAALLRSRGFRALPGTVAARRTGAATGKHSFTFSQMRSATRATCRVVRQARKSSSSSGTGRPGRRTPAASSPGPASRPHARTAPLANASRGVRGRTSPALALSTTNWKARGEVDAGAGIALG